MSTWSTVLISSGLAFVLKFIGYLVPPKYLEGKKTSSVVALLPVALLTGLVCVQAFVSGKHVGVDPRAAAAGAAIIALLLRAPFIVVVLVAAGTAALIRLV